METPEYRDLLLALGATDIKVPDLGTLSCRKLSSGWLFGMTISGEVTQLLMGFRQDFPLSLPEYFLMTEEDHPGIPHVETDGRICYMQSDYLSIDFDLPAEIIRETLEKACGTIAAGLEGTNSQDFTEEFEAYWSRLDRCKKACFNGYIKDSLEEIKFGVGEDILFINTGESDILQSAPRFLNGNNRLTYRNGLFIPLNPTRALVPPKYRTRELANYVRALITEHTSQSTQHAVRTFLEEKSRESVYLLFSLRHTAEKVSLFAVGCSRCTPASHLLSADFAGKVSPFNVTRLDRAYLYKRGSNGINFQKKGLIIGCGSIGGYIAENLIRSGIFDLHVADDECLTPDNCYRHVLGYSPIGELKVTGLKKYLESKFPHAAVTAHPKRVQELLESRDFHLTDYDFIVMATGNVTVNAKMNRTMATICDPIPVVYTWNDPYGIGGHCLLSHVGGEGCYECLYANEARTNSASFAHPEQPRPFLKSLSGCGSAFTPYSAADSVQTALIATRLIIDVLGGRIRENRIESWKGDTTVFTEEGYRLSPRAYMSRDELEEKKSHFAQTACNTCGRN